MVMTRQEFAEIRDINRLQIAAMIEPSLITNPDLWKREGNYYRNSLENTAHCFAKLALEYADALIYDFEKGVKP